MSDLQLLIREELVALNDRHAALCVLMEEQATQLASLPERIRSRIFLCNKKGLPTPCWLWTGTHSGEGKGGFYGRVSWLGCTVAVHRLVWFLIKGKWPRKQLDHECEARLCCNPDHETEVTNRVNNQRRVKRSKARGGQPAYSSIERKAA